MACVYPWAWNLDATTFEWHDCVIHTSSWQVKVHRKINCPWSRIEVRPSALLTLPTLTFDRDLWHWLSIHWEIWSWPTRMQITRSKVSCFKYLVFRFFVQKLETERRTRPIALPCPLTRSVKFTKLGQTLISKKAGHVSYCRWLAVRASALRRRRGGCGTVAGDAGSIRQRTCPMRPDGVSSTIPDAPTLRLPAIHAFKRLGWVS